MKEEDRKIIEEIMDGMRCSHNFKCVENGFEMLCKAQECELETHLECLECNRLLPCLFTLKVDKMVFCQCPLRVYIGNKIMEQAMIKIGGTVRHKSRIDGGKYEYCCVLRIESSDVIESYRSIISTESERSQNNFKDQ